MFIEFEVIHKYGNDTKCVCLSKRLSYAVYRNERSDLARLKTDILKLRLMWKENAGIYHLIIKFDSNKIFYKLKFISWCDIRNSRRYTK